MKYYFLVFVVFFVSLNIAAQKVKFGKIDGTDLRMEVYPNDSSAEAVVLSDIGKFDSKQFTFFRHLRIKILKPSGTRWANKTLYVPNQAFIDGIVFNIKNGEMVKQKVSRDDIQEQELTKGNRVYKVFFPNVKVGSVIDLRYRYQGLPYEWRFQELVPVKYSELTIEPSPYIDFSINSYGFEPVETITPGHHWKAENVPAFTIEPFLSAYRNYLSTLEFDIRSVSYPGYYYKEYTASWESLNQRLYESQYVYSAMNNMPYLNEFAKSINDLNLSFSKKIDTAYTYIQQNIKWDQRMRYMTSNQHRQKFLKDHSGNSADINLALVALLNKMDIEAYPVAMSTRSHGYMHPINPSLRKLNYIIGYVEDDDGKQILLDATDPNCRPGTLPRRALNGQGRLISKDFTDWIPLTPVDKDSERCFLKIQMNKEGQTAQLDRGYSGYAFLDFQGNAKGKDERQISNIEESFPGLVIHNYNVRYKAEELSAHESISANISNLIDDFGQEVLLSPLMFSDLLENPLKRPDRKYPVDLGVPIQRAFTIMINYDDQYELKSLPESTKISLSNNMGSFSYMANKAMKGTIQIQVNFSLNQAVYM